MIKVVLNNAVVAPYSQSFFVNISRATARYESRVKGVIEINIIGSVAMKKLNRVYRGKNSDTDVLSFPWQDDKIVNSSMLGEIYLCYARVKRQAKEFVVPEKEEMARMLIHGLLHLVGHDHGRPTEAKKMFGLQEKILAVCQPKK